MICVMVCNPRSLCSLLFSLGTFDHLENNRPNIIGRSECVQRSDKIANLLLVDLLRLEHDGARLRVICRSVLAAAQVESGIVDQSINQSINNRRVQHSRQIGQSFHHFPDSCQLIGIRVPEENNRHLSFTNRLTRQEWRAEPCTEKSMAYNSMKYSNPTVPIAV